jgi:hypothetical protein
LFLFAALPSLHPLLLSSGGDRRYSGTGGLEPMPGGSYRRRSQTLKPRPGPLRQDQVYGSWDEPRAGLSASGARGRVVGRMQSVLRTTSRPETNIKTFFCMYVEASVLVSPPPRSRDENDDQDLMVLMACSGELFYRKTDIKP